MIFCSRNIQISQQSLRNNVNELVSAIVAKVTNDDDDYGNIYIIVKCLSVWIILKAEEASLGQLLKNVFNFSDDFPDGP